jgi:hypothetical protein
VACIFILAGTFHQSPIAVVQKKISGVVTRIETFGNKPAKLYPSKPKMGNLVKDKVNKPSLIYLPFQWRRAYRYDMELLPLSRKVVKS